MTSNPADPVSRGDESHGRSAPSCMRGQFGGSERCGGLSATAMFRQLAGLVPARRRGAYVPATYTGSTFQKQQAAVGARKPLLCKDIRWSG
jgi:hypothetical protein